MSGPAPRAQPQLHGRDGRQAVILPPRATLRPLLLLLLSEGTGHGYELLEQVQAAGLTKVDTAVVYRCLRAMDEDGLVVSHWEPSVSGPARRTYVVTAQGREVLGLMVADLRETARALEDFLSRYRRSAGADGQTR